MARGNKAHRDEFVSIPAETKQMLRHVIPAIQHMPKADRVSGAGAMLREAALGILTEYHIAYRCPPERDRHIERMIGYYGVFCDAFEIACLQGIMRDEFKLNIAQRPGFSWKDKMERKYHLKLRRKCKKKKCSRG